jgi:hypothetical protein
MLSSPRSSETGTIDPDMSKFTRLQSAVYQREELLNNGTMRCQNERAPGEWKIERVESSLPVRMSKRSIIDRSLQNEIEKESNSITKPGGD